MKKILKITMLFLACMLIVGVSDVDAQYGKKKKKKKTKTETKKETEKDYEDDEDYFDESGGKFTDKLWYGGGFTLGYASNSQQSVFAIGVSPMVGYKITDKLSFGPRLVIDYSARRFDDGFEIVKLNSTNYGGGVFGRFKAFRSIFFHTEFELFNEVYDFRYDSNGSIQPLRQTSENFYLGAGYSSTDGGGGLGYEFLVLYNALAPDDVVDLPIEFRFGLTWGF